ncbi:hypothetical protein Tco_0763075 [Tanacetum coccineum]
MSLGNQRNVDDAAFMIDTDANPFIKPTLLDWNRDEVIVISSDDDESGVNEPIPALVEDADVEGEGTSSDNMEIIHHKTETFRKKKVLSKEDLKGTRIEQGFKRAFMSLFGQDNDTFTSMMLLNVDQLQKQLNKDEFQEDGSMEAFWVINRQFQMFMDSQLTLDYDNQMADKYFAEYTGFEVKQFRDTLLQYMGNVKKFVAERTRHQIQYDGRVNKRKIQTHESKVDMGKAVDADLFVTESRGT